MNETLRVCDAKVGQSAVSDLTGIIKVVDQTSCDVAEVRYLETSINFESLQLRKISNPTLRGSFVFVVPP